MLIAFVVKEPFEVRIGKNTVFKLVDAEGAVTDAALVRKPMLYCW